MVHDIEYKYDKPTRGGLRTRSKDACRVYRAYRGSAGILPKENQMDKTTEHEREIRVCGNIWIQEFLGSLQGNE